MSDEKRKIEIEIVSDAKKFRTGLESAAKQAKQFDNVGARMRKAGLKDHKELAKLGKQMKKFDKSSAKESISHEKALAAQMKKTASAMKEKLALSKGNRQAVQAEAEALRALSKEHSKLVKSRKAAGYLTGGERVRSALSSTGRGLGSGIAAGAAGGGLVLGGAVMMALKALANFMSAGYTNYLGYMQSASPLIGAGATTAQVGYKTPEGAYKMGSLGRSGMALGYTPTETISQATGVARQTGFIDATTQAQQLSRVIPMGVEEGAGFLGTLARAGRGGFGSNGAGKQDLVRVLAMGFESGLKRARIPEFMQGVASITEQQASFTTRDVNSTGIARILALLGQSGLSGLQGVRGAALASQLDTGIRNPGAGEAGQAFMMQAFGFGVPGGKTSYYDALKRQQQGLTEENLGDIFSQSRAQYGGGQSQALALSKLFGITIQQVEDLRSAYQSGDKGKISAALKNVEPLEKQSLDAMKDLGESIRFLADRELEDIEAGGTVAEAFMKVHEVVQKLLHAITEDLAPILTKVAEGFTNLHDALVEMGLIEGTPEERSKRRSGFFSDLGNAVLGNPLSGRVDPRPLEQARRLNEYNEEMNIASLRGQAAQDVYNSLTPDKQRRARASGSTIEYLEQNYSGQFNARYQELLQLQQQTQQHVDALAAHQEATQREIRGNQPQGPNPATANPSGPAARGGVR